jgi:hypothetical protein
MLTCKQQPQDAKVWLLAGRKQRMVLLMLRIRAAAGASF